MRVISSLLILLVSLCVHAEPVSNTPADIRIAIVIDDLGDRWREGSQAVSLPGDITIGIIPYTPYAKRLADSATHYDKEVILHLPMEAMSGKNPGKGGLLESMSQQEFFTTLKSSLEFMPQIHGVNNHMGSLLTQNREKMRWLMQGLFEYGGLYFLDSRTVDATRAMQVAEETGVPTAKRDVFLDHRRDHAFMQKQWHHLLQLAKSQAGAICIAHPYAESLLFLQEQIPTLQAHGIQLMRVSRLIQWRQEQERRKLAWHTSTSSSR